MKKTYLSVIAIILIFVVLVQFSLPVFATYEMESHDEIHQYDVSGIIVIDNNIDMEKIELKINSAVKIYDDNKSSWYYDETYEFSVFPDANGYFYFDKPSSICSIQINRQTIPQGYSACREYYLLEEDDAFVQFTFNSNVSVNNITAIENKTTKYVLDVKNYDLDSIKALDSISVENYVNGKISNRTNIDIFEYNTIEKIDYLYSLNLISSDEKINLYCDFIENKVEENIACGLSVINELTEYETTDVILKNRIDQILSISSNESFEYISGNIGSFTYRIYYNQMLTYSEVLTFEDIFVDVYNYFIINNRFLSPLPNDGNSYYSIYLMELSVNGLTSIDDFSGESYIKINVSMFDKPIIRLKETLAHELAHAIMFRYHIPYTSDMNTQCFHESFAGMSSLVYCGEPTDWHTNVANSHIHNFRYSINTIEMKDKTFLFPLYIFKQLGGWTTIRNIYEEYVTADNVFDAITESYAVSTYREAFLAACTHLYDANQFYSLYVPSGGWNNVSCTAAQFTMDPATRTVNHMACDFIEYSSSVNMGDFKITFTINSNSFDGMKLNKIIVDASGNISISTVPIVSAYTTIGVSDLGSSNVRKLILVPTNTNLTGTISYSYAIEPN